MKMNGAAALIQALEDLDVEVVFGLPGVQNIELYDALYASDIKHVLVRHEQAAVHMADGYARATGKIGVVFATSGPGATNTVTGIATAYMDSVPVIVITGQVSTAAIGTDAFQEADITTITLPITKHSYLLKEVDELVPSVFEAFYVAQSGRPGPVLIDVPGNVAQAAVTYHAPKAVSSIPSYKPTISGNARQIKAAAELLRQAARPVLLAGGGVVSSAAACEVVRLAELYDIPVVTTLLAKGVIAHERPCAYGQPGVYGAPKANAALQKSDLVIAIGTRFSERVTGDAAGFAPQAKIIHIDIDPAEIGKNIRVDVPIVGDAATVLAALLERLEKREAESPAPRRESKIQPLETVQQTAAMSNKEAGQDAAALRLEEEAASFATAADSSVTRSVFMALDELLSTCPDLVLTTDVGQHQLWASHLLNLDQPRRFLTSGGLGTMGFGLPAALGAQIACPDALVLCISGDGSFQMNVQEMATAVDQKLPVKVAIINNTSLGLVRQWQELFLDKRYAHTMLSSVPSYEKLASAYGWQGRSYDACTDLGGLKKSLRWLLKAKGPALLEIIVPSSDLLEPMVKPGASLLEVL